MTIKLSSRPRRKCLAWFTSYSHAKILLIVITVLSYLSCTIMILKNVEKQSNLKSNLPSKYKMLLAQRRKSKPIVAFFNGGADFINVPILSNETKNGFERMSSPNSTDFNSIIFDDDEEMKEIDENILLLDNEKSFLKTLKSCIHEKCFHEPKLNGKIRIAIMAPPGAIADGLFDLLNTVLNSIYDPIEFPTEREMIQLIRTTHVPPYGYGKNHGWTKIIRLVTTPLPIAIADVLLHYQKTSDINNHDINYGKETSNGTSNRFNEGQIQVNSEAILRQIVRFHGRLTHVAAHTTLLTIDVSSMQLDFPTALQNIIHFLMYDNYGEPIISSETSVTSLRIVLESFKEAIRNANSYASQTIVNLWQIGILEDILREELSRTNRLRDWPSKSFWDMGNYNIEDEDSIPYRVAKDMVPDCEDNTVKCTIRKDFCEVRAKVECD